jgi:adenosylcobinamide kinase / adenosylcobinamide-phosphate guanylyltransferase
VAVFRRAAAVPDDSGGPATESHRVPLTKPAHYLSPAAAGVTVSLNVMRELIIGGVRSGKSALAQQRARQSALAVVYVATARAEDAEMARRVAHHRQHRPPDWICIEEPLRLASMLRRHAGDGTCILVDCLTLWLSNLFFAGRAAAQAEAGEPVDCPLLTAETAALLECLPGLPGRLILVSNEVGWGIVPINPVARAFADEQGRLNQRVAAACERVTLTAVGLPLELKSERT